MLKDRLAIGGCLSETDTVTDRGTDLYARNAVVTGSAFPPAFGPYRQGMLAIHI